MFRRVIFSIGVLALAATGPARAGVDDELSLLSGYATGDYGTRHESETQSLTLRYVVGEAWQLRAELPRRRNRNAGAHLRIGPGPTSGGGPGGNGSGGGGDGSGSLGGGPHAGDWVTGIGDLRLSGTRTLVGGGAELFHLDAGAQVKAPVADEDDGLGTGEWDFRAGVSGEYRFWSVSAFGGVGWNRLGDPYWVDLNDVVDAYVGLESAAFGERVTLAGWIDGYDEIVDENGEVGAVGFEVRSRGKQRWRGAVTIGLGPAAQDFGVLLGYSFTPGGAGAGHRGMLR
jgi:hypothetical protein